MMYRKKENNSLRSNVLLFQKTKVLSSSIRWPSNLVCNVPCTCSLLCHKSWKHFYFWLKKEL